MKIVQTKINSNHSHSILKMDSLNMGQYLVFDIYIQRSSDYIIIIEKGTLLSQELFTKLKHQEKLFILKEDIYKKDLTYKSLQDYTLNNQKDMGVNLGLLNTINQQLFTNYLNSKEDDIEIESAKSIVKTIIFLIQNNPNFLKEIIPHFSNEHELSTHSLSVCIYSLSIAILLKLQNHELVQLGTAAILHDVGLKKIDDKLLDKNDKLSTYEMKEIQKHPLYSTKIIKQNLIFDPYIIDAITHHHENYDGTGYPDSLEAKDISIFASIISIADVFDALTNNRPARKAYKSFEALKIMMQDESMAHKFNHTYLQLFLKLL